DVAGVLDPAVHLRLHVLPDRVAVGADDHAALDRPVVGELRLQHHVEVPLRVVVALGGDLLRDAVLVLLVALLHHASSFSSAVGVAPSSTGLGKRSDSPTDAAITPTM